jgi:hypothetical protein
VREATELPAEERLAKAELCAADASLEIEEMNELRLEAASPVAVAAADFALSIVDEAPASPLVTSEAILLPSELAPEMRESMALPAPDWAATEAPSAAMI